MSLKRDRTLYLLAGVVTPIIYIIFLYRYLSDNGLKESLYFYVAKEQVSSTSTSTSIPTATEISILNLIISTSTRTSTSTASHLNKSGCDFPKLDPFEPTMMKLAEDIPKKVTCDNDSKSPMKYPLLFRTDMNSNLILLKSPKAVGLKSCCYKKLFRSKTDDDNNKTLRKCNRITSTTTRIPEDHEFIAILCQDIEDSTAATTTTTAVPLKNMTSDLRIVDILSFTRLKPEVESRIANITENSTSENFSVLLLGLDSVAHMNFLRTMPKSHKYLVEDLNALEFNGFVSIGGSTRPNIFPVLTGHTTEELQKICGSKILEFDGFFDDCPLIWKNYSAHGYRTSYGEDGPGITAFNYNSGGFKKSPTDYYLRPLLKAADDVIKHWEDGNAASCYGPRSTVDILLNHVQEIPMVLGPNRKYFQFIWSNAFTHDDINYPKLIDQNVHDTLKFLKEGGHMERLILIFMSDHGMRWGDQRSTYQGQMEARLPLLYIVIPELFKIKYPNLVKNLEINRDRLMTPFDIHETLQHILILDNEIEKTRISNSTRALSLFEPIPLTRTCESAEIPEHFCVCHKQSPISINATEVQKAASKFVTYINEKFLNFTDCANLTLHKVWDASTLLRKLTIFDIYDNAENSTESITLIRLFVETLPGLGQFEATMTQSPEGYWSVISDVRVNMYKNQSHCVNDTVLKNYCYCKD